MEKWIFKYAEFLLISHNCVIIPDLGAFIINEEGSEYSDNDILKPKYSLIFNQDLKHNDGLLSSFIQQHENISYQASCKKIKQAVLNIKTKLQHDYKIECHNLGEFVLNENGSIHFNVNKQYIFPANWGLQPVFLQRVVDIEENIRGEISKQKIKKKYHIGRFASAAALIFFFFMPSLDLSDQGSRNINQQAGFTHLIFTANETNEEQINNDTIFNKVIEDSTANTVNNDSMSEIEKKTVSPRTYYIILGSEKNEYNALALKKKIESDFPDIALLKEKNRYRLYSVSFDEKPAAEEYLNKFRNDNPKYKTAWLYSKKNI